MPQARSQHLRGWVRSVDVSQAAGKTGQLLVEIRLADTRGVEHFCDWRSVHYLRSAAVPSLDIRHGDDIEIRLDADDRGRYTRDSYVHNHTRDVRYTLVRHRSGCLAPFALLALPGLVVLVAALAAAVLL